MVAMANISSDEPTLRGVVVGQSQFTAFELCLIQYALGFALEHTDRKDLQPKYRQLRDRVKTLVDAHPHNNQMVMLEDLSEIING